MRTSVTSKGIILEQNKEPALSREIKVIKACEACRQHLQQPVSSTPGLLAPYEIVAIAKEAKIVDEIDGVRLWKKLAQGKREGIGALVIDAMDDEPYISSQLGPALQKPEELEQGAQLIRRAIGASKVHIEIYKNLFDVEEKIPSSIGEIKVERVGGNYPAGSRARLRLKNSNALVIGAGAALYLYRAAFLGLVQTTCFVTVAGNCIANPANYEVPIGMPVGELLETAGLIIDPKRIVVGGSMTGYSVTDPMGVPVGPRTRGVLAFASAYRDMRYVCIGCGRCAAVCPQGLSPYYIYKVMHKHGKKDLSLFDAELCTGCGTCSYVCPAKLDLAQIVRSCAERVQRQEGEKDR